MTAGERPTGLGLHNPLPAALARYELELVETLAAAGMIAAPVPWSRPVEGIPGIGGKGRMLANALGNLRSARSESAALVQLWPSLGLLEARAWSSRTQRRYLVLHDPEPLDAQVGHSRLSEWWAARASPRSRPTVVVHSDAALAAATRLLPRHRVDKALHPILSAQRTVPKTTEPSVVVAGQFKAARDVALLERLGPKLRRHGWHGRIVGRGWPSLPGWDVDARFVSEGELDQLLGSAWAVLIPYTAYFQSGIAIRALENGTPTVGQATDFLAELQPDSRLLLRSGANEGDYLAALAQVEVADPVHGFADYRQRTCASWERLLVQ